MSLRQRLKDVRQFVLSKCADPTAFFALKREVIKSRTDSLHTIGAIWRCDVAARGFFKCRTLCKDKLFRRAVTRYLVLKFGALCFRLGQFFLGRFVAIAEYLELILEEGNTLHQNGVAFHTGEQVKRGLGGRVDGGNIHDEPLSEKDGSDC